MTVGTATVFKSGTGIALIVPKNIALIEKLEAGSIVEIDIKSTGYTKTKKNHFQKKDQLPDGEAAGSGNAEA